MCPKNLKTLVLKLPKQKCIQISSNDPNVNLKFLDLLNEKRRNEYLNDLISIGTCGLYTVSRAFQNAENSTDYQKSFISYS